ncbi:MAG: glycosyl transferase [Rickettsiales bacterium]|nr:glycosyl transferase [Rickettsiales bacterium]|tara:strand:- start:1286 stop:2407 length:1122 start_codon:yes stop_codon:yes gene_type:complete
MKIALVHYWFYGMRGGEKVVKEILRLYPEADIFTHLFFPENLDEEILKHQVNTTFINSMPLSKKLYQAYLPLMPWALKRLNLNDYDLIISSESGPSKGVKKNTKAKHICYCHSPMRYIWDQQSIYLKHIDIFKRWYLKSITPFMRRWDIQSSKKVDHFIANSSFVSKRIERIYNRPSNVIYPPVDLDSFEILKSKEDYFILAGQLVSYKRPSIAIEAFNKLGLCLKVIGTGEMLNHLKSTAKENIEFLGFISDEEYRSVLSKARALIFPGVEDFGIVPVEAQAAGTPVIALAEGGALETVAGFYAERGPEQEKKYSGLFFEKPDAEDLIDGVRIFINNESIFSSKFCQNNAKQFSKDKFHTEFSNFVDAVLEK